MKPIKKGRRKMTDQIQSPLPVTGQGSTYSHYLPEPTQGTTVPAITPLVGGKATDKLYTLPPAAKPTTPYVAPKVCHTGNVGVFDYMVYGDTIEDVTTVTFYGGGTTRGSVLKHGMLLIALQSHDKGDPSKVSFTGVSMPSLEPFLKPRVVNIDITDGQAPNLPYEFWDAMLQELVLLAGKEPDKHLEVLVRCAGGHGRTGVVLCCFAIAADACPGVDPIAWIRDNYCGEAVENAVQKQYVEGYSGILSTELMRPFSTTYPAYNQQYPLGSTASTTTKGTTTATGTGNKQDDIPITKYDIIEEYTKLYVPKYPIRAESSAKGTWYYDYADKTTVVSTLNPLVGGVIDPNVTFDSVDSVIYNGAECVVIGLAGDKRTVIEKPIDEEDIDFIEYDFGADIWVYTTITEDFAILHIPPTVFGQVVANAQYEGKFIAGIYYNGDDIINIDMMNGETCILTKVGNSVTMTWKENDNLPIPEEVAALLATLPASGKARLEAIDALLDKTTQEVDY